MESLNYVSRQDSLKEFKSWSGFGEELEILDDKPIAGCGDGETL